jgi:hypothetical protein
MTKAQKENQLRFKKVQAEAKKLKAKNPKLKHVDAVKQAWAILYNTGKISAVKTIKTAIKKKASKLDVIKKPIGLYYDNKLIKQFDTVAQSNKYQMNKIYEGYDKNLFFTQKFAVTAPIKKKVASKKEYVTVLGQRVLKGSKAYEKLIYTKKHSEDLLKSETSIYKPKKQSVIYKPKYNINDDDRQTGFSDKEYDSRKVALLPGKRIAYDTGNVYYERRANRSDKKGSLLGVKKARYIDTPEFKRFMANNDYVEQINKIFDLEKEITRVKNLPLGTQKFFKESIKKELVYLNKLMTEYKTHARELKKLL